MSSGHLRQLTSVHIFFCVRPWCFWLSSTAQRLVGRNESVFLFLVVRLFVSFLFFFLVFLSRFLFLSFPLMCSPDRILFVSWVMLLLACVPVYQGKEGSSRESGMCFPSFLPLFIFHSTSSQSWLLVIILLPHIHLMPRVGLPSCGALSVSFCLVMPANCRVSSFLSLFPLSFVASLSASSHCVWCR